MLRNNKNHVKLLAIRENEGTYFIYSREIFESTVDLLLKRARQGFTDYYYIIRSKAKPPWQGTGSWNACVRKHVYRFVEQFEN